ncbi:MAG: hypothetical protein KGS61_12155, partial [Verrucomicrobia bacterium]|nr:hypothetical protein [Verrucomicrobiota bacterium]
WFLLCAVKRFLINEREHARAAKRGGAVTHLPFDGAAAEGRYQLEAADLSTPDKLFDRAWAVSLIERVHRLLQQEYALEGKTDRFDRLSHFLAGDKAEVTYAEVGRALQMTPGAVKVLPSGALATREQVLRFRTEAAGRQQQVGRRSDVYALGAILYHLLTGRPPFVGETLADLLPQVAHGEPLRPRQFNPAAPVDLETICLKCLEKEPARRMARSIGGRSAPDRSCPSRWLGIQPPNGPMSPHRRRR